MAQLCLKGGSGERRGQERGGGKWAITGKKGWNTNGGRVGGARLDCQRESFLRANKRRDTQEGGNRT